MMLLSQLCKPVFTVTWSTIHKVFIVIEIILKNFLTFISLKEIILDLNNDVSGIESSLLNFITLSLLYRHQMFTEFLILNH